MATLGLIVDQRIRNYALLEELEGELTEELEQALELDEQNLIIKAHDYIAAIDELSTFAARCKEAKAAIDAKAKAAENRAENLKRRLASAMEIFGHDKLEVGINRLRLTSSVETVVDDIEALPEGYYVTKVTRQADKKAIKAAIQAGGHVAGAHLQDNHSVVIK